MTLKITQLMLAKGFGGAERLFVDVSVALAQAGVEVQAVFHTDFLKQAELHHPGILLAPVNVRGAWDLFAARRITAVIRDFQPAVIHSHLARGAKLAGRAARALRIPLAVNLHNYVKLKYYRDATLFIPGTVDQKQYLVQHGIAPQRIEVIPHFSLLSPVSHLRVRNEARPVLVSYGRLVKKKGFDVLLHAFKRCTETGSKAHLRIGGDGPERASLVALAEQLDLVSRVEFCGWVDDVTSFLDSGDIFILPSLDEPFGIVVLEAMARGKTIVSTKTKGPNEVLNEEMAYLAEVGDVNSLELAMSTALRQTSESVNKASAALAAFRNHYSKEAVIPQFEALYRRMARA